MLSPRDRDLILPLIRAALPYVRTKIKPTASGRWTTLDNRRLGIDHATTHLHIGIELAMDDRTIPADPHHPGWEILRQSHKQTEIRALLRELY